VGFVCSPALCKTIGVAPNHLLQWAVERCPVVRHRLRACDITTDNQIVADFSYTCKPVAGDGYFLLGDAGSFLDPIFSTGVALAMMSARCAAEQVKMIFNNQMSSARARRTYIKFFEGSTGVFWHLIRNYYTHSFRELFLEGEGPLNVHGAIISILAGHVFPKPPWSLRWRLWLFDFIMQINRFFPLVPKRQQFSLLNSDPVPQNSVIGMPHVPQETLTPIVSGRHI
jgi:hypothetical protein